MKRGRALEISDHFLMGYYKKLVKGRQIYQYSGFIASSYFIMTNVENAFLGNESDSKWGRALEISDHFIMKY